jgi:phosphomannomutase
VRPSGTEDILRIYSEAKTVEEMNKLGENILNIIETQFKEF